MVEKLRDSLSYVGYQAISIRVSALLERTSAWSPPPTFNNEARRIGYYQTMGNRFREKVNDPAALARAAIVAVREERSRRTESAEKPCPRVAYIIDQLKHPAEVDLLRRTYGSCFLLIGAHAPELTRVDHLASTIAAQCGRSGDGDAFRSDATQLIQRDAYEEVEFGQNTRDTYPKSDFFVDLGMSGGEEQVQRFVALLFGHPFHTPTKDEYAMYQASAASLRSSDTARQVGASIATTDGDVVAVGTNEVPYRKGGLYWVNCDSPDARDQALGVDRGAENRAGVLVELIERLGKAAYLNEKIAGRPPYEVAKELMPQLKGTKFMNIGEFGRTVHAEMASLIDAARRGVSVDSLSMYVTTFPCHNCAKHIIAAGIRKVVYLEPYPKSRADALFKEEIALDPVGGKPSGDRVTFAPFSGVAPRQYHQIFSMTARGAKKGYPLQQWTSMRTVLTPIYVPSNAPLAYIAAEKEEISQLSPDDFKRV